MKAVYSILVSIILGAVTGLSQEKNPDSLRVLYAEYDSITHTQIIPLNALKNGYDVLVLWYSFGNENECSISWPADEIDGQYSLVINPKEMYLRTCHENPNSPYLYWIDGIQPSQYEILKTQYKKRKLEFHNYKRDKETRDGWTDNCYQNFKTLMKKINTILKNQKIEIPDYHTFNSITQLRIARSEDDINGGLKATTIPTPE
ncbi:MAG: hypothetical protein IPM69_05315 [Ignavibacteria bacterium]|nr:hypothetical protein [Ignavibacteria bacterium]